MHNPGPFETRNEASEAKASASIGPTPVKPPPAIRPEQRGGGQRRRRVTLRRRGSGALLGRHVMDAGRVTKQSVMDRHSEAAAHHTRYARH